MLFSSSGPSKFTKNPFGGLLSVIFQIYLAIYWRFFFGSSLNCLTNQRINGCDPQVSGQRLDRSTTTTCFVSVEPWEDVSRGGSGGCRHDGGWMIWGDLLRNETGDLRNQIPQIGRRRINQNPQVEKSIHLGGSPRKKKRILWSEDLSI